MEKARTSIWRSFKDTIKSFVNVQEVNNGKIDEERLTADEKELLAEIRKMDKVETLEGRVGLKSKYGAKVDTKKAKENAKAIVRDEEEKTIESK